MLANCEPALSYYSRVAAHVANHVSVTGGTAIQRVRLIEEAEGTNSQGPSIIDDNLLQYYQFLAEKGDVSAQVSSLLIINWSVK